MPRPTTFDSPMTAAERMRKYRARKKDRPPAAQTLDETMARATRKEQAHYVGRSVRHWQHHVAFGRFSLIEWDGGILDGKYGRCGMAFLAEVCRYGDVEAQQAVHDQIKRAGADAGRALWVRMVFDDARRTGCWAIAQKINNRLRSQRRV